ncbi:RBBP8 N-terminal-like protein [Catharus ustulatus]|uniref:RBBP8 N-terminal-like protein n=1 Tax=Catharus ustulatus TaxID=91951 RepID=UPI0014078925|nr:RBBP8 N-terminal-like protein [Catharus ustulatus]
MTTESFTEFLNKLKEIHEKEVQGLHSKVTELTTEKCRDAQRIEELFAKNHQLREQQKVLKENVKVLENRLRAGLCDRCMVTQELAKKKQNEYETSHFQSLQHIFILSNETNRLREENKTLKEELKRLRSLEDRTKTPGVSSRESCSTPSSPLTLLSPVSRSVSTEKAEHREAEEAHQDVPDLELSEEKPLEKLQRSSPSSRTSPGTVLQEVSLAEIASQRISNQLHGTIALVRPGSKPCLLEKSPSGAAVSPPARKTPVPPEREHSPSLEAYLTASKLDSPKVAPSYENLKLSARREQLCLLHKHLSLQQLGLGSPCSPAERDSFPSPLLRTRAPEGRTRSRDGWEEHAALLKLPATMVYVRDQHLEEKLQLLKQRERLQHLLLQQCQPGQRADGDTKPPPGQRPPSPWLGIAAACKEERIFLEDAADGKGEKELWLGRERCELRAKVKEARDDDADAPLDLSEPGRGRDTEWHGRRDSPGDSPAVPAARGGHRAQRDHLRCPYHWPGATRPPPGAAKEEEEEEEEEEDDAAVLTLSRAYLANSSTPSDPEALPEAGIRRDVSAQKEEADDNDAESGKQESDEPDTTDSEEKYEDEMLQEAEADGKYFCTKDKVHVQQRKRKRGQDPWIKGSKKSMRGKKKIKVEQCPVGITKELENCSDSHNDPSKES